MYVTRAQFTSIRFNLSRGTKQKKLKKKTQKADELEKPAF